jgi:hypothetical protein
MSKPRTRRRFHTEATNFGSEAGRTRQQARHNPSRVGRREIRVARDSTSQRKTRSRDWARHAGEIPRAQSRESLGWAHWSSRAIAAAWNSKKKRPAPRDTTAGRSRKVGRPSVVSRGEHRRAEKTRGTRERAGERERHGS